MRPTPKLIDPSLLNKVNEVYIAKTQQSNSILLWLFNTIGYYFKQNILFSTIVVGLIGFLLYRYIENIKRKNKILKNLNSDKPIEIKLEVPIDYNNKPAPKEQNQTLINKDSKGKDAVLSEISVDLKQEFDKDIENDLKLMNDPDEVRIAQNPQQSKNNQQQQSGEHNPEINPMVDRMPMIDPKVNPNQTQYRSTNPDKPSNFTANESDNMNEEVNHESNVLQKSNVPQVQSQCGVMRDGQPANQPTCGFKPKKNAYLETSEKSEKPYNKKRDKSHKSKRKHKHKKSKRSKKNRKEGKEGKDRKDIDGKKKKDKKSKKSKKSRRSKKESRREPRRDRHEEEIMNIFEREMAITNGSISRERLNKESKFKPTFMEDLTKYDGPMALNTFSDNFQVFE